MQIGGEPPPLVGRRAAPWAGRRPARAEFGAVFLGGLLPSRGRGVREGDLTVRWLVFGSGDAPPVGARDRGGTSSAMPVCETAGGVVGAGRPVFGRRVEVTEKVPGSGGRVRTVILVCGGTGGRGGDIGWAG